MFNMGRIISLSWLLAVLVASQPTAVMAETYNVVMKGFGHWVNATGKEQYPAEARLCLEVSSKNVVVSTPGKEHYIKILFPANEYAMFRIPPEHTLKGDKQGNIMTFIMDQGHHARIYYAEAESSAQRTSPRFKELYDQEKLYLPVAPQAPEPWGGAWQTDTRVEFKGIIYRARQDPHGYLDLGLFLVGEAVPGDCQ